jgi:hypothetical protein
LALITGKQENPTVYAGPRAKGNFMVLRTFVHDGVNIYRKGFRAKTQAWSHAAAAVRRTTANPYKKKQTKQQMVK